jgi:hypothetical protein
VLENKTRALRINDNDNDPYGEADTDLVGYMDVQPNAGAADPFDDVAFRD